jgi:ubiquinone/menaquinone biosynthesis C-methylase UbiE
MSDKKTWVCPVGLAGGLEIRFRRWIQDPRKILGPYIKEGMTVMDFGCGPGYFTIDMAHMVGKSGRVIAADLQEGMLQKLKRKINGTDIEARITLHRCEERKIGLSEKVDFILIFYVMHEIPDHGSFLKELRALLRPNGKVLIVEPPLHVSKAAFQETLAKAREAGFTPEQGPKVIFSRTVILTRR